ncbi:O-acetyl-ADP-ribose deacetylase [bacterium]|nr:O-acetyl-ADP-ribose deacetylase [bacterium]
MPIHLKTGDITKATVDAIVNAANPKMLGGGGVDGAIHAAAGPSLLEACRRVNAVNGIRCPFGDARLTPAGHLAARWVIHAVGPIYHRSDEPASLLASAYDQSLTLAVEYECRSVAFPAISCGAYGYPAHEAAQIAIDSALNPRFSSLDIYFYLYSQPLFDTWQLALNRTIESTNR